MKSYDIAFSLGATCGVSRALRSCGLQYVSYPLDWTAVPDILTGVRLVTGGFKDWFEAKDLDLYTVSHTSGFMTRWYMNRHSRIGFTHEFSDFSPFRETYPKVRETYERRSERLLSDLRSAKRILAVWHEVQTHGSPGNDLFRQALGELRAAHPSAEFDLICFYEDPEAKEPKIVLEENGLTVVAADFREMDGKLIAHYQNWAVFARLFQAIDLHVPDSRSDEEKRAYATYDRNLDKYRWGIGKSPFRRWLNKYAYKMFRTLEGYLLRKGLIHGDVSCWFWPEIRREAAGGGT